MPIIIRHNGALNSLAEGFAAGSQGMAQGLAQKRALEQRKAEAQAQDDRYYDSVRRAEDEASRERERQTVQDQTAQALGQAQVNQVPGAAPGGVGPEDPVISYYRAIAPKLTKEDLPRFAQDVELMARNKNLLDQKERHLSALKSLGREPGVAPFMDEELQTRIQNAMESLQGAESPDELAQILPVTKQAIDKTGEDLAARHARAAEVEQVGGYYQQQIAQDMQNAMLERNPMVRSWKLEQLDKQRKYVGAFLTAKPGSVSASQFMSRMAQMDQEAPAWMQKPETGSGGKSEVPDFIPKPMSDAEATKLAIDILGSRVDDKLNPIPFTVEEVISERDKLQRASSKRGSDALPFAEAPKAGGDARSQIAEILRANGIDPDAPAPQAPAAQPTASKAEKAGPKSADEMAREGSAKLYEKYFKKKKDERPPARKVMY